MSRRSNGQIANSPFVSFLRKCWTNTFRFKRISSEAWRGGRRLSPVLLLRDHWFNMQKTNFKMQCSNCTQCNNGPPLDYYVLSIHTINSSMLKYEIVWNPNTIKAAIQGDLDTLACPWFHELPLCEFPFFLTNYCTLYQFRVHECLYR